MNKKLLSTAICATMLAVAANSAYAQMPPPPQNGFNGGHKGPHHEMVSPQERQQKIAEFEKRLNLTEEQKAKIEKNREASKKKLDAINKKEENLRQEKRAILEQNKKDFESILNDDQKAELKKIEQERFEKMKAKRQEFEAKRKEFEAKKQQTQQTKPTTKKSN